ncbi:MAG: lysophospholipid acyltransferase family protein [Nanoarchaeota archaeon]
MVYPIARILRPVITFPVKQVEGLENLPKDIPFVVAANHTSFMDFMVAALTITKHIKKRKIYVISAMILFFDFLAQIIFSEFGGSIRVKKKNRGGFLKSAIMQLRKGNIIIIFPEGVPNKKPDLRKGKVGVARLVLTGQVPVVPMGITGTLYVWSKLRLIPRPNKKVVVTIGKPMYFDEDYDKSEDYETLVKVTRIIMKEIGKLTNQDYPF